MSGISFISDFLIYLCDVICGFVLDVCSYVANMENLLLPIKTPLQLIGAISLLSAVLLLFILPRKKLKISLYVLAISFVVFSIGTVALFVTRNNNTYITAYSYNKNDVICVEENNELTVIDISNHSKSSVFSRDMSVYLGYGEISKYVIKSFDEKLSEDYKCGVLRYLNILKKHEEHMDLFFETYKRIVTDCLNPDKTSITPYYRFIPETIDLSKDEIRIKSINVIL